MGKGREVGWREVGQLGDSIRCLLKKVVIYYWSVVKGHIEVLLLQVYHEDGGSITNEG